MQPAETLVFVYGTLRTGASQDYRMRGATSLGSATIQARLYRVHQDFPGITLSGTSSEDLLQGEVFSGVSPALLDELDLYEGCNPALPPAEHLYRRVRVSATLQGSGKSKSCWVWEYRRKVKEEDYLANGDWLKNIH